MEYDRSSSREKWTIMMYMRDFNLMTTYAYALRSSNDLSTANIDDILIEMENKGVYNPRNGGSTFTGQFKSIQIAWYMFGYYNKARERGEEKKMVFSPLGNLLLDNLMDKSKTSKIFLTMLFGNGFRQPFSQMDNRFNIFAYRLIFQLLRDKRLDGKLYDDEVFYLVMFMKTIEADTYEELVSDILELRSRRPNEKYNDFKMNERVCGLACHEWRYSKGMLESAGILNIHEGIAVGDLTYGSVSKTTGRPNAVRKYVTDYVTLAPGLENFVDTLLSTYPYYIKPYPEDELTTKFNNDIVVDLYSFYPPELLSELGMNTEEDKAIADMLNIASNVNYYSHEETEGGKNFEFAIKDAFNMFRDVEAERVAGAGNPDIECLYYPEVGSVKKFDIEAKARKTKLMEINPRRLRTHRTMIGSKYTMIVAPNYAIGVIRDIAGEESVVVKSATLANYIYQSILKYGRDISYESLDEIIAGNIGKDITDLVNAYVYSNFGHGAEDISVKRTPSRDIEVDTMGGPVNYTIHQKEKYVIEKK